jgi:outer membrane biosynthesis protein TonB
MPSKIRVSVAAAALAVTLPLLAGCAEKTVKAQARVEPPPAPLEVPQPPARVIVPPQPEAPAPVEDTQPPSPARTHAPKPAARTDTTKPDTSRPETANPETPPAEPPQPAAESKPVRADAASVAAVRQQMSRAAQNLSQVNYAGLSNDMKAQFDTANRFLALAEQALKEGNLLFASTLTDKAGAIASLITGR